MVNAWICGGSNGEELLNLVKHGLEKRGVYDNNLARNVKTVLSEDFVDILKYNRIRELNFILDGIANDRNL